MPYSTLPDRRIPYDNDGSVVAYGSQLTNYNAYQGQHAAAFNQGWNAYLGSGDKAELNDTVYGTLSANINWADGGRAHWFVFPETRLVTGVVVMGNDPLATFTYSPSTARGFGAIQGSTDSTNGVDGTWEAPSVAGGVGWVPQGLDTWRKTITSLTFVSAKRMLRFWSQAQNGQGTQTPLVWHLYGEKAPGQTPDDIIFIDHDTTPGVEYQTPEDFGDRPLGTTVVRQFRIKNTSGTLTANTISLTCNDADFVISTDNATWVVTINIASLGPGAESATMYIRNTTPAPGATLGPRATRIVATVGTWT